MGKSETVAPPEVHPVFLENGTVKPQKLTDFEVLCLNPMFKSIRLQARNVTLKVTAES